MILLKILNEKMKKVLFFMFLLFLCLGTVNVRAQVRIGGNTAPNASAVLDLNATDATNNGTKGLALPRVNLTSNRMQLTSGIANLNGMLVYNANAASAAVGIYYWADSIWIAVAGVSGASVVSDTLSLRSAPPTVTWTLAIDTVFRNVLVAPFGTAYIPLSDYTNLIARELICWARDNPTFNFRYYDAQHYLMFTNRSNSSQSLGSIKCYRASL